MLIRLISLVFLLFFLKIDHIISLENDFLLPISKPSVFKKLENRDINKNILPIKKPKSEVSTPVQKKLIIKTNKKIKKPLKTIVKKVEFDSGIIIPKKKPRSYKVVKIEEKSQILNKKDFEKAKLVFSQIKSGKWTTAFKTSKKVKDKDFKDLVSWLYLLKTGNVASFNDYKSFITNNSDYPRIGRLRYLAEHKIYLKNSSAKSIINWFLLNPPTSGMGKLKLAESLLANKQNTNVVKLVKEGWITAKLSKSELRYYRNKFKSILNSSDHINRADYLAWEKKYWDLKRMLRYLPKDEQALYNARQILMSNSYGVDTAISRIPAHLKNDIGLQFDRLRWRNRRGRLEPSLEILYENSNKSEEQLKRADLWWKQRESIVRSLIYKKRYKTAYKVASEHSLSSGANFAEAEWLSGWVAHTFLGSQEYAINHFLNFYSNVGYPISLARGAYWLGKSYKALGDSNNANKYFTEGSKFLTTYYGQLSFNEINENGEFTLRDDSSYTKEYEKKFLSNKLIKHVKLLKELDQTKYSKDIIKYLATIDIEQGSEVLAAKLATDIERYDYAIQIAKQASYQKRFFLQYNYPIITTPRIINQKTMPPSEFVLAIIRQESEFDRKANSYVGARGMMQLMKYTAKTVAKQAKLPYSISGLTKDPEYNIKLGSYYFNSLLENYSGVYPFAIAAYNAGPNRVKTWRRVNGDPTKNELSYIDWIELIRFKETRNYVQRVLENVNVYKYMIRQKPVNIERFFQ